MSVEVADLVATLGTDATAFYAGMAAAETRMERGAGTIRTSIGTIGRSAMAVGLGLGGALAAGLSATVGPAMLFEQTMSGVKAVSGATAVQMKGLSDLALKLGKDTVFSASQAGQGIEELVKGGISIADIMNGAAKATLNLAAAGGVDLTTAAEIAANAMNMFGISGKNMSHVADMIAGAANASSLDVMDFRYSLAYAGNAAHASGVSFDDLAVAIAELGQAGIKGSSAGTGLQDVLTRLAKPTGAAAKEMRQLGLITAQGTNQFFDAQGHLKRLADVQGILAKATAGLTDQQRLADLQTIFGQRGMRTAIILAGDGAAGFDKMATAMGKVTAASVAQTRMGNLAGMWEQFKGSLETLEISIGLKLIPRLTQLTKVATDVVNTLIDFTQTLPPGLVQTATTLAGIAAAALTVGGAAAMLVAALNPITLAVGGLVLAGAGLAAAWANDWGGIREKVQSAWGTIRPIVRGLQTEFGVLRGLFTIGGAGLVWTVLQSQLKDLATAFVAWVPGAAAALVTRLEALASQIGGWIRSVGAPALITHLQTWADAFWAWVRQAVPPLMRELGTLGGRLWSWITGTALPALITRLQAWGAALVRWVQPAIPPLVNALGGLLARLSTWITGTGLPLLGTTLATWGGALWHWIRQAGPPATRELAKLATLLTVGLIAMTPRIMTALNTLTAAFGKWLLTTGLPEFAAFGLDIGDAIAQGILDGLQQIGPKIADAAKGLAGSSVKQVLPPGVGGVLDALLGGKLNGPAGGVASYWSSLPPLVPARLPGLPRPHPLGPPASALAAAGGQGSHAPAPAHITVNITPTGMTSLGGTAQQQAIGRHVGDAADEALREIEEALRRGGPSAQRLLGGVR